MPAKLKRKPASVRLRPRAKGNAASGLSVDSEQRLPMGAIQIVSTTTAAAFEHAFHHPQTHRLDLSLGPRPAGARACYTSRWGAHRFERVGPLMLIPRGLPLAFKSQSGRQSAIVCLLRADVLREAMGGDIEWTDRRLEASLDISSADIRSLLRKLAHEVRHPGLASRALINHMAAQLAIELARYFIAIDAPAEKGGLAAWRLRIIDERIAEMRAAPTLSELAALCNLSARQLARGFRTSRGSSIGDHIAQTRIDLAKRLLLTEASITDIAERLGFSSLPAFSFAFRRGAGVSPRQFRTRVVAG